MTAVPPSPEASIDVDAFDAFREQFPAAYKDLLASGYESAGADVMGRCHEVATLFLELQPKAALATGWIYDGQSGEFIGPTYRVKGEPSAALARVRELVESTYAQQQLSGDATRSATQHFDDSYSV